MPSSHHPEHKAYHGLTANWYHTQLGQALLRVEHEYLAENLTKLVGLYLLQMGGPAITVTQFWEALSFKTLLYLSPNINDLSTNLQQRDTAAICGEFDDLPFLSDSMDAVLIEHVLEFTSKPHMILEEIYHALRVGGSVIILGFNPYSLWGLSKLFKKRHAALGLWHGRFISAGRIKNWLEQLGFQVEKRSSFYFSSPSLQEHGNYKFKFMEKLGKLLGGRHGGIYMLVAKKISLAVSHMQDEKVHERHRVPLELKPATPSTRNDVN
jgi:SAM-dependent methyltransferase